MTDVRPSPNSYAVLEGWEQLPEGLVHRDVTGVSVDKDGRVYVLARSEARVLVFDPDGRLLSTWGEEVLSERPHGISVDASGAVWIADEGKNQILRFSSTGEVELELGSGMPSVTGFDTSLADSIDQVASIRGGPPFNRPTAVAIAPNGDIYVADGYGNARVHRFSPTGDLLMSFGGAGGGEGEFRVPHALCFDALGRLLVADRGNERIHLFTPDGEFIEMWDVQRPNAIATSEDGLTYIGHSAWKRGNYSWRRGTVEKDVAAYVSIVDATGRCVATIGGHGPATPGNFTTAHAVAVDSTGDVYVGDVTFSSQWRDAVSPNFPTLQKIRSPASQG